MSKNRSFVALMVCAGMLSAGVQAQESAGQALWVFGKVERVGTDGVAMPLSKGSALYEGDEIRAGADAHAQLVMSDEALLAVRPNSSLRLDTYRYAGREDGSERAMIELVKGGMRSITGAVGRTNKDNFRIRNKSHLIGIRGTDHETFATEAGTYNRVTAGGTYLESEAGRLSLSPGEVGFASLLPGAAPSRLDRTPDFMHLAALHSGNTGPQLRESSSVDQHRAGKGLSTPMPEQAVRPVLPTQALGDNSQGRGWGNGGRCGGPCADPLNNNGKGKGKGRP